MTMSFCLYLVFSLLHACSGSNVLGRMVQILPDTLRRIARLVEHTAQTFACLQQQFVSGCTW
jgi:hypothetical protein